MVTTELSVLGSTDNLPFHVAHTIVYVNKNNLLKKERLSCQSSPRVSFMFPFIAVEESVYAAVIQV